MKQPLGPLLLAVLASTLVPFDASAGEWGVGLGVALHQPPQKGADSEFDGGPFPFYDGNRLSLGFGSASYALANSERFRLAVEGQVRFEGYDPKNSIALAGMDKRRPSFDAGFSVGYSGAWGEAQLRLLNDLTGTHKGYEVSASYQLPFATGRWLVVPSIGFSWRSDELVDYYYGVRDAEARSDRPGYHGRATTNAAVGVNVGYTLSRRWQLVGGAEYVALGDNITDSPITEKDHTTSVFTALVFRFK